MSISALILAAGSGSRMNLGYNKMLYKIDGDYLINKTLKVFIDNPNIDEIVVTVNEDELNTMNDILLKDNRIKLVIGDIERYKSVYNGLQAITKDYVLIHDGARCFLSNDLLDKIIQATIKHDAAFLGVVSKDTIHIINENHLVYETTQRSSMIIAQTPQGFKSDLIKDAYTKLYQATNDSITDDVSVALLYGDTKSYYVESSYSNLKVTTIEDIK